MDFNEARQILNKNGNKYTDEQVRKILEMLQVFVANDLTRFENEKGNTIY